VHRDIKPPNILVRKRTRDEIEVVLADFGVHGRGMKLEAARGTECYAAPELWKRLVHGGPREPYSPAVDIWSLGLSVYEIVYGLLDYREFQNQAHLRDSTSSSMTWCEWIVHRLGEQYDEDPDDVKKILKESMLIICPEARDSARVCHEKVMALQKKNSGPGAVTNKDRVGEQPVGCNDHQATGMKDMPPTRRQIHSSRRSIVENASRDESQVMGLVDASSSSSQSKARTRSKRSNTDTLDEQGQISKRQRQGLVSKPLGSHGATE
jgi:serine/threonine protein kinase